MKPLAPGQLYRPYTALLLQPASTFWLNILLALLLPVGTVASVIWFVGVRPREREILADPHGFAITTEFD